MPTNTPKTDGNTSDAAIGRISERQHQVTAGINRPRNLLLSVHPALERALGENLAHPALLGLLARYGGPAGLQAAGRSRIDTVLAKKAPRMHAALADRIWTALGEQSVVVAGTAAVEAILPKQAAALAGLLDQRKAIAAEVERVLDDHPLARGLHPDLDAGSRGQDRRTDPGRGR